MRALAGLLFLLTACQADPLDLEHRKCGSKGECVAGYVCDPTSKLCVRGKPDASIGSGGAAGSSGGSGGTTPAGGSAGSGGSSGSGGTGGSSGSGGVAGTTASGGASGAAGAAPCTSESADCDQNPDNGCETKIATDPKNCGACGRACSNQHVTTPICTAGACVSVCELGFANCATPSSADPDDGCETDATVASACGGCGNQCSAQGMTSGFSCGNAAAPLCGCAGDDMRCGGGPSGQCEASGLCHCGSNTCRPGEACKKNGANTDCACNGGAACSGSEACCQTPSGCRDLDNDSQNCGACGHACAPGASCVNGACV
jgi:hypothetical protein